MKKSFVLHLDSLNILNKMTDEQAGKFIKIIYQFQNTKEVPEDIDFGLEMAISPFINQFQRDENKWQEIKKKRQEAGRSGGLKSGESRQLNSKQSEANEANASNSKQSEANEAVNVSVNVNGNVSVSDNIDIYFEKFWQSYKPIQTKDKKCTPKGSKKPALKAYEKAVKNGNSHDVILGGLSRYLERCKKNDTLTCAATTFLNQERFLDEDDEIIPSSGSYGDYSKFLEVDLSC